MDAEVRFWCIKSEGWELENLQFHKGNVDGIIHFFSLDDHICRSEILSYADYVMLKNVCFPSLQHPKGQLSNNPLRSNCRVDTPFHRLYLAILFQPEQCTGHLFLVETSLLHDGLVIHPVPCPMINSRTLPGAV